MTRRTSLKFGQFRNVELVVCCEGDDQYVQVKQDCPSDADVMNY